MYIYIKKNMRGSAKLNQLLNINSAQRVEAGGQDPHKSNKHLLGRHMDGQKTQIPIWNVRAVQSGSSSTYTVSL